jgi:hypothetical protein
MKKIVLSLTLSFFVTSALQAVKLSEFLTTKPVGQQVAKSEPSPLVPDNLVGKNFTITTEPSKKWQVRFFTFEDRDNTLADKKDFAGFVKAYGLDELQSQNDSMPYKDGTLHSFTYKEANKLLKAKGEKPLPKGVFFVISFRDVTETGKKK